MFLFTDGSVNTKTKIGCGAYLLINELEFSADLKDMVKINVFNNTSSSSLEVETLLWALKEINIFNQTLTIYTDSQNIIGLPERRKHLEDNNYYTKKGILIRNHSLYKEFYSLIDRIDCEFIKIPGHRPKDKLDTAGRIFSLVDKASRKALRNIS